MTGINKQQTPAWVSQQWQRARRARAGSKPSPRISQGGSQLSSLETVCAPVLCMKGLLFLRNKKSPGRVVYLVREVLFCVPAWCGAALRMQGRGTGSCNPKAAGIGDLAFCKPDFFPPLALFLALLFSLSRTSCRFSCLEGDACRGTTPNFAPSSLELCHVLCDFSSGAVGQPGQSCVGQQHCRAGTPRDGLGSCPPHCWWGSFW